MDLQCGSDGMTPWVRTSGRYPTAEKRCRGRRTPKGEVVFDGNLQRASAASLCRETRREPHDAALGEVVLA
jgi:hypothetical protein